MKGIRSRAVDAACPKCGWCVTSSIALGLPRYADPAMLLGMECVKQWLVIWMSSDEYERTRICKAWKVSLEQLRDGSSRWIKVRGLMRAVICVLMRVGSTRAIGKRLASLGMYWSFTGAGDAAELIELLSRDIMSVH